jgi:hypothetical protein
MSLGGAISDPQTGIAMERRLEALVIGPGKPDHVKVALGQGQHQFITDVPIAILELSLRMPNSTFVAVVNGRELVRVESSGPVWLTIQDQIRAVLNGDWDPISVAHTVEDEYDAYISEIYSLLRENVHQKAIADHLLTIEVEGMGLVGTPMNRLLQVASNLRKLQLPSLEDPPRHQRAGPKFWAATGLGQDLGP